MKSILALVTITAVLAASLGANAYFYDQQNRLATSNSDLQTQAAELQTQVANCTETVSSMQDANANLTAQLANLNSQVEELGNQTSSLQAENSNLQSKQAQLQSQLIQANQTPPPTGPKLVTRLGASDMQYDYAGSDIRLYISGEVWNVGADVARNCRLQVTLHRGGTVVKDTYIELGTIYPATFRKVATNIYYTGVALTGWTIIPEYS